MQPRTFDEFWPYYVSQHQNAACRAMHVIGTSAGLALAALTPVFPPALIAAPIVGYGTAWIGHFVFEGNKPATWGGAQAALWSLRGDFRMLRYTLTGRMGQELARVRAHR